MCSAHSLYGAICAGKMGWSDPRTIPPRSSEDSKGCKVITATGNRMPLLKTASHNTASESVASLTFFFPLSSFTHYQFYFSLNPQILQFSCKGSVSYKLFFFFFFACWVSSLFYWGALQLSALNTCCRRPDATIWFQKSVHFPLCDTVNCDLAQMSLKKKKKKWVYCLKFFVFVVNQNVFSSCHLHKRFQAVMCYDTAMPLASLS